MNAIELNLIPIEFTSQDKALTTRTTKQAQSRNYLHMIGSLFLSSLAIILIMIKIHVDLSIINFAKYKAASTNNTLEQVNITPPRAPIVDRHNTPLTINKPAYNLYLNPKNRAEAKQILNIPELANLLTKEQRSRLLEQLELEVLDIEKNLALLIKERYNNPAISIKQETIRTYPYISTSHAIGYIGPVTPEDISTNQTLLLTDQIGKTGLERYYDEYLRGKKGIILVERNSLGQTIAKYEIENNKPKIGQTLVTTLDINLQRSLYSALESIIKKYKVKAGAAILIDPYNGEILAYVSYPTYDANIFTQDKLANKRKAILEDKRLPLFDRVVLAQLPPGSTFKTIVTAALLEEKVITPNTRLLSSGTVRLSGGLLFQNFHRKNHGLINVKEALMVSSNVFFCRAILKLGIDRFLPYAQEFGIGQRTGIDMPYEAKGRLPSPEEKIKLAKTTAPWLDPIWYPEGDTCNSAIGQGITLVTPVQLAKVASIIANGGTPIAPHLGLKLKTADGKEQVLSFPKGTSFLSSTTIQTIKEGMYMSVNSNGGLLKNLSGLPIKVAAKSGTAEFGKKDKNGYENTHGWVIGFFPYKKPKIAFVVMLENGGSGIKAAEVIRNFILNSNEYLQKNYLGN